MTDLSARADRVRQIAEQLHGNVLDRDGDTMRVEIPSDLSGAAASSFGRGGYSAVIVDQTTRMEPRRVLDMDKRTVVDHAAQDLMAFYTYRVDLHDRHAKVADLPHAAAVAITRPTKPTM